MYKDKDRQRQAVREAVRRYRAKGITPDQGITAECNTHHVIPKVQHYSPLVVGYEPLR